MSGIFINNPIVAAIIIPNRLFPRNVEIISLVIHCITREPITPAINIGGPNLIQYLKEYLIQSVNEVFIIFIKLKFSVF